MLQLTPTRIVPGLPDLKPQQAVLKPWQDDARALVKPFDDANAQFEKACDVAPGLRELSGKRAKLFIAIRAQKMVTADPAADPTAKAAAASKLATLTGQVAASGQELATVTASHPQGKAALLAREGVLKKLGDNRDLQLAPDTAIKTRGKDVQFWQEFGGLIGRLALAALLVLAISRGALLRIFLIPGLFVIPLTYLYLFHSQPTLFALGIGIAGFFTVAQFSYFGEYLPKVFPIHLRGTGGSFATNVGGRMIGTSAALVTTNIIAPMLGGQTPAFVATAAAIVGTSMFALGLVLSFFLPEPPTEQLAD